MRDSLKNDVLDVFLDDLKIETDIEIDDLGYFPVLNKTEVSDPFKNIKFS